MTMPTSTTAPPATVHGGAIYLEQLRPGAPWQLVVPLPAGPFGGTLAARIHFEQGFRRVELAGVCREHEDKADACLATIEALTAALASAPAAVAASAGGASASGLGGPEALVLAYARLAVPIVEGRLADEHACMARRLAKPHDQGRGDKRCTRGDLAATAVSVPATGSGAGYDPHHSHDG